MKVGMTLTEIIERLQNDFINEEGETLIGNNEEKKEVLVSAIRILNKQIPLPPIAETYTVVHEFYDSVETEIKTHHKCPVCKEIIRQYAIKNEFCHRCGQAIRWENLE